MKKFIVAISILLLCSYAAAQQQDWESTGGPKGGVQSIYVSGTDLYAVNGESFYTSSDQGTWQKITLGERPVTVNCFAQFDNQVYVGTERDGIYYSSDGTNWQPIENNDKLQDSLHVSAITIVGQTLLANVYHVGSHGNHSRIYRFEKEGRNLEQAVQFDTHLYVYSFTPYSNKVLMATDKGIYIYNMDTPDVQPVQLSNMPAIQIVNAGAYYAVPERNSNYPYFNYHLYKWDGAEQFGSWSVDYIGLYANITELVFKNDGWYATTDMGIYSSPFYQMQSDWSRVDQGIPTDWFYASSIAFLDPRKFVGTNKGLFTSQDNGEWTADDLPTSSVNSIFSHKGTLYAGTVDGLFQLPAGEAQWTNVPDERFKYRAYTTHFAEVGDALFIGTENGIAGSHNNGQTWSDADSIPLPSTYGSTYYSQWFNVKSLVSIGQDLFTVTYETPYISGSLGVRWMEISDGLPDDRVIKGLVVIKNDLYLFLEQFPFDHDVWFQSERTSVYRFDRSSYSWQEVSTQPGDAHYYYFPVALGAKLIYLYQAGSEYSLRSIDTDNLSSGVTNLTLPTEGYNIVGIYVLKGNIFIPSYGGATYVSFDEGRSWEVFTGLPQDVRSITTLLEKDNIMYAGLGGHGVWKRRYTDFFLPEVSIATPSNTTSRTTQVSGTISSKGSHSVTPWFEYSKTSNFSTLAGTVKGTPALIDGKDKLATANLVGLEGDTEYYVRLRGEIDADPGPKSVTSFRTLPYLNVSNTNIDLVDADPGTNAVTAATTSAKPVTLTLSRMMDSVSLTLHTRGLASEEWNTTLLNHSGPIENFTMALPYDKFDELGLEYFFTIFPSHAHRDPAKPTITTEATKVGVRHPGGLSFNYELQFGSTAQDYNLISFPLTLTDPEISTILKDVLGGATSADKKNWRLLTYVGEDGVYKEIWDEYPDPTVKTVTPGRSYWLAIASAPQSGTKVIKTGAGATVVNFADGENTYFFEGDHFNIELRPGYNQIGNPFTYNVKWSDVKAANQPVIGDLVAFDTQGDDLVRDNQNAILEPFKGGYVYNSSTSSVLLKIPTLKNKSINGGRLSGSDELVKKTECYVGFTIKNGHHICKLSGLGVVDDASSGNDKYDLVAPPSPGSFPSIVFSDKENGALARSLVPPQGEGQVWDFDATTLLDDQVTVISWNTIKAPAGNEFWLHDLVNENLTNMMLTDQYKFVGPRHFRVYYGTPEYIRSHRQPDNTMLHVHPNPLADNARIDFTLTDDQDNCDVKFSLVDMKGREVSIEKEHKYEAGFHSLEWNTSGAHLQRGVYLVRMEVSNQGKTRVYYQKVIRQ